MAGGGPASPHPPPPPSTFVQMKVVFKNKESVWEDAEAGDVLLVPWEALSQDLDDDIHLAHGMRSIVGNWDRLARGEQLFRVYRGAVGVMSEGCGGVACQPVDG